MTNILYHRENGVSYMRLNRPKSFNALDVDTLKEMLETIREIEESNDSIVVISGEGKAFCAGGDVRMMVGTEGENKELFSELMGIIEDITMRLYMMPKIVIVAVNGSAAGLGLSLALNSDYIVANEEAKFGMLFAGIGLIPDGGGHFFLQERLGTHHAKQFIWGLNQVKGTEAKEKGFVDILTDGDAYETVMSIIPKIQASPLRTIIKSKVIYHTQNKARLQSMLDNERDGQLEVRQTEDHQEGVTAFIEKRIPEFKGM